MLNMDRNLSIIPLGIKGIARGTRITGKSKSLGHLRLLITANPIAESMTASHAPLVQVITSAYIFKAEMTA